MLWLAVAPTLCWAQQTSDWISYRDVYRQMIWFEKYGKPKQFLQNHFRLRQREAGAHGEGLRLTLVGKTTRVDLPLDALGRAVFPFSKAAYDENAELVLNRPARQFSSGPWVSLVTRADGVYAVADLVAACEQMAAYLRYAGVAGGKSCAGVQFSYAAGDAPQLKVVKGEGAAAVVLAGREGPAFAGDAPTGFRNFAYRFAAHPGGVQVLASGTPLAISALLE
ncbi:hypothetical protein [Duganella sp. CF517]|uniref:hypothetical protein n=1 Tax=Duganella sp. CF517 TaxID=1881038 RepID=UPI001E65569D|nr:hypothetical protein [Duganella sp. CF517]